MTKRYRIEKAKPEFYFHFELGKGITNSEIEAIIADLQQLAQKAFEEEFSDLDIDSLHFEVDLGSGSIRGWIRPKKEVVRRILLWLAVYGGAVQGGCLLWNHTTGAMTWLKDQVVEYFETSRGVTEKIHMERRRGAVARLDRLIDEYQQGNISYEAYMAEATAVLKKIQKSPDRDVIIPALQQYMTARNVNWQALEDRVPVLPRDGRELPTDDRRQPDMALLEDDTARRKKKRPPHLPGR